MASASRSRPETARRGAELRTFLRSRRARVSPAEAGLPDGGPRRRTPGLRREEVAVLAGVGASWYQWLEQGRDITVSPQVLDAVARVLRMSAAERRHLYVLAGLNPPLPESEYDRDYLCDGLQRLIDTWMPYPAHIMDPYYSAVGLNESARLVMGMDAQENCIINFFCDERYRARSVSWEQNAPGVVAELRASLAEWPQDEGFQLLLEELLANSDDFRRLWELGDVCRPGQRRKELHHPVVGALHFESTTLQVPARPDLRLILHNPVAGTGTAERLQRLAEPEVRRATLHQVAG
ncbi:helix-turn-helix transcriptional regulator [Streptomyces smyrnaeus]|uniref:helix-turn-helix transcriptional regulator n=1 Tax=Streptomyces TaxID=1883 RepID=UPI000C18D332|nr:MULTISPECIES: helix-turn-helix transcriptional regulator [unclassified Streptomyces]MBQ0863181.1 helix-turn-helix domain-containing protein [Streptomyces sp. RK75]MBQ1123070.1 helix-turn-helix domain-containing protein [Streptomyces sp. B15]MBQ1157221.1 helix-turn-helix domain-containing protein [Streptomyces sp. A73]